MNKDGFRVIVGFLSGDRHYAEGDYKTARRVPLLKKMLEQFGVEMSGCA